VGRSPRTAADALVGDSSGLSPFSQRSDVYSRIMNPQQPPQPKISLSSTNDYRENYANSVQVRVSLWDFFLLFGIANQSAPDVVAIQNFQGVFLSPQQAKALANVLNQNVSQYESTFGEIKLEPKQPGSIQ
jgi:hypothetical protein